MTTFGDWKSFEWIVAVLFSGIRDAFSGARPHVTGTRGDVRHSFLFIECKLRRRHAVATIWRDAATKAEAEHKIPVVVLAERGQTGCLIVVHSDDLDRLARAGRYDDLPLFREL